MRRTVGNALVTVPSRYPEEIADDSVDSIRFSRLVRQRRFAEALQLWRANPPGRVQRPPLGAG